VLPPDQYVASLARKRMAATAFFRDEQGRVLLVNPVYKETWDLPGGAVEAEESPHAACRREVAETALVTGTSRTRDAGFGTST
jgi:ADP-ribose pyrophosphatase YjhB (NUDIX family)